MMPDSSGAECQQGQKWDNWAGTIEFQPACYFEPTTLDDLLQVLQQAQTNGKKVRVAGSGHSWSLGAVPGPAAYVPDADVDAYLVYAGNMNPTNAPQDPYLKAFYFTDSAGTNYVAVPPGTPQGWLADNAANANDTDPSNQFSNTHPNLALGSMGPAPDITLGGFVANGCHGTGWQQPTVSDLVYGIEVATIDGSGKVVTKAYTINQELADLLSQNGVTKATPEASPDMMAALRVSLGALGAITKLVFRLEPLFNVAHIDEYADVETIFPANGDTTNLQTLVTSSDYLEIFWFPYIGFELFGYPVTNQVWVKRYSKTNEDVRNEDRVVDFTWITSELAYLTGGLLGNLFALLPGSTPGTLWTFFQSLKLFMLEREMKSPDFTQDFGPDDPVIPVNVAYLYQLKYFTNLIDLSYTVPIPQTQAEPPQYDFSKVLSAWNNAVNQVQAMAQNGEYPVSLNVHLRFVKNSDSLLSPANHGDATTHTCYIEFLSFSQQLDGFSTYSQTVGPEWAAYGGLPHWAKIFQLVPDAYADSHQHLQSAGNLQPFLDARQQLDPGGFFMNDFLNQLLNGQTTQAKRPSTTRTAAATQALTAAAGAGPHPTRQFAVPGRQVLEKLSAPDAGGLPQSARGCSLVHDSNNGVAVLLDEDGAGHFMDFAYDSAAGQMTYTLRTASQFLSPGEVFLRVGEVLKSQS